MKRLLPVLSVLGGCTLEPSYIGPWDITAVVHAGEARDDLGFVEFQERDSAAFWFLRYTWDGGAYVPLTRPEIQVGSYSTSSEELPDKSSMDGYASKGERFFLTLGEWGGVFEVVHYDQRSLDLVAEESVWFRPGLDASLLSGGELVRTELTLVR